MSSSFSIHIAGLLHYPSCCQSFMITIRPASPLIASTFDPQDMRQSCPSIYQQITYTRPIYRPPRNPSCRLRLSALRFTHNSNAGCKSASHSLGHHPTLSSSKTSCHIGHVYTYLPFHDRPQSLQSIHRWSLHGAFQRSFVMVLMLVPY